MRRKILTHFKSRLSSTKHRSMLHIKPFVLFAFCFFIYTPKFNIPSVIMSIISYGVPIVYLLFNLKLIKRFNQRQWMILFFASLLSLLSVVVPMIFDTGDYSYFVTSLAFFKKAVTYIALLCLIIKTHGEEKSLYYFMYYFALIHVAYAIGTLCLVLIPKLHDLWFSIVEKEVMLGNVSGRLFRTGWLGFSGFRLTLYCTFSVVFALYLRFGSKKPIINTTQFLFLFIGCITGNMFYGRSGLIVSLIVSALGIVYWNRKNLKRLVTLAITILLLIGGVATLRFIPGLNSWYEWMSSPIVNLITTGDMQDKSFDRLQEMQQVEIQDETLVFGDGYYNKDGHYYMRTDAGFKRNILFWGLFGALISYGATLYCIFGFSRISRLITLQMLVVFIAFEYKGAVYYEFLPLAFAIETALAASNGLVKKERVLNEKN